ncbi:MAG TPA: copper resistance CopC family protein [Bradyrhizobium sp.]|uniref:copper resistance CopC family protein n=1 Tax=Bradyrhizobium sp. TaxID=376 RepID=UPI002CEE6939|nr:copper resistance CopC family protein [Bradyrhizobium sp.]HLZ04852.1 copper resistance CopC family protein [Bradyrhizobium sp.]
MKSISLAALAFLVLVLATGAADAHALLDRAEPRVGNRVAAPPREVTLWFTQNIRPVFSSITVTNAAGERVDTGKAQVRGNQMSVPLRVGGSGTYHVNWHVLSMDSHTTNGNFTFQVGQ